MKIAMGQSFTTVAASAATTVLGFTALLFMRFGIGSDLGLNLVKGVLLSFLTVMVFLPALTLLSYPLLDKTKHRSFIPSFRSLSKNLLKTRYVFLALALILVVPSFLAQSQTSFQYGTGSVTESSRAGQDAMRIEERFGHENILVLLVPKGNTGNEMALSAALENIAHVKQVVSYVSAVGQRSQKLRTHLSGGSILFRTLRALLAIHQHGR
jgi:predicted RND superfamily exporter protein